MNYKHILLATDLSESSLFIANKAKSIAQQNEATLDIVHVIEHSPIAYGGEFSIPIDVNLEQAIEAHALQAVNDLANQIDLPIERRHLVSGTVKHRVFELAKELQVDLIVMGTHGHSGFDKLLGSRANAILHIAESDVLAVRCHNK